MTEYIQCITPYIGVLCYYHREEFCGLLLMEVIDVGSVRPRRAALCESPFPDTYQPELNCIAQR